VVDVINGGAVFADVGHLWADLCTLVPFHLLLTFGLAVTLTGGLVAFLIKRLG
jgi:hypothetical protein